MTLPWRDILPLSPGDYREIRRRMIFDFCKWDPQVEDTRALCDFAVALRADAVQELNGLAVTLAHETLAAERELLARPDLHKRLGLSRAIRWALRSARKAGPAAEGVRVMRFDFHATSDGWRVSEVNSDVPGGFIEASAFARLVAPQFQDAAVAGDPADALADELARDGKRDATVGLVHATAYIDDRQVMVFLARRLAARGLRPLLLSPADVQWRQGYAHAISEGHLRPIDHLFRFFPAEWLENLPRSCGWRNFFAGSRTPLGNPGAALLTQSKRFPLVWDELNTSIPTWRALLPETRDPRGAPWRTDAGWVVKPALGRVGDGIGMPGVTDAKDQKQIARAARWFPSRWIAQRRFTPIPLATQYGDRFPCFGVFVIGGRAAGIYGRLANKPLVNHLAQDVAVLVHSPSPERERCKIGCDCSTDVRANARASSASSRSAPDESMGIVAASGGPQ